MCALCRESHKRGGCPWKQHDDEEEEKQHDDEEEEKQHDEEEEEKKCGD